MLEIHRTLAFWAFFVVCQPFFAQSLSTPTAATLALSSSSVDAGKSIKLTVDVNRAPSTTGSIDAYFQKQNSNVQVSGGASLAAGQKHIDLEISVPADAESGTYDLVLLRFSLGQPHVLTFQPVSFLVHAQSDLILPTSAQVALSPTQQQFLETRRDNLQGLLDALMGHLLKDARDTPELRTTLRDTVMSADKALLTSQRDFDKVAGGNLAKDPILFEDFHLRYSALLIDLSSTNTATVDQEPHLMTVQLTQRTPRNLSGTYPPVALATISLMQSNIAAYVYMLATGLETFEIQLSSIPPGATVSYFRVGHDPETSPEVTDTGKISLPLAVYTFKFKKEGCVGPPVELNPFNNLIPTLTGELKCKRP